MHYRDRLLNSTRVIDLKDGVLTIKGEQISLRKSRQITIPTCKVKYAVVGELVKHMPVLAVGHVVFVEMVKRVVIKRVHSDGQVCYVYKKVKRVLTHIWYLVCE